MKGQVPPDSKPNYFSGSKQVFWDDTCNLHTTVNCRAAPQCAVGSGHNNSKDCASPNTLHFCCNYSGNCTANYGGCHKIREVEKDGQFHKLCYWDEHPFIDSFPGPPVSGNIYFYSLNFYI
ncbi:hypothetical protein FHG87_004822 [Trinorchestia longiramus]|nr:hypothetical protein FHG87_004822 [Trinorchestia longiramus]